MKTKTTQLLLAILWLIPSLLFAQKYTINGYVMDATSGEKLIGVNIYDARSGLGTVSNTYGFYSLTLPEDSIYLGVSYVGYQTNYFKGYLNKDFVMNFELNASVSLEEVEVVAKEFEERIEESTQMSKVDIPIAQIKKIPALLGEVDVLKALQLLPGVQSGGEGQSGLYVRGGSPDQNLILLDGVPVYNASHLFGFFSVFNADAIKDVTLTKGGFPARYGGRLSSVIEINMKEGNSQKWHGAGSIGIVASKLTLEGPIKKDKTSIILSARRTYIDILARPLIKQGFKNEGSDGVAGYFFYDLNAKINHKFSEKDRLYLSVYTGKDKFQFKDSFTEQGYNDETELGLGWGNLTSALRWNHLWTNKLFSNTAITYSRYNFNNIAAQSNEFISGNEKSIESFSLDYLSGINDIAGKIDFDFVPNPAHFIRFGVSGIAHDFKPGTFDLDVEITENQNSFVLDTIFGQSDIDAVEFAAYVEDDMRIGKFLKLNAGLHFSGFSLKEKTYVHLQPRLSLRYLFPKDIALKASFATMRQYVQLLTNEGLGLPTDLWLPTTENVKPQDSWQVALGLAKTFKKQYEVSIEAYYKEMSNILSYKEGANFFQLNDWQERVTQGNGQAYGLEFFLQKKRGKLTGWIGYTIAYAWRQFDDLNFGKKYSFKYDRRHDISVVASYQFNKRIQVSGTWVYGTGNAVTLANSVYNGTYTNLLPTNPFSSYFSNFEAEYYEDRNNYRMRAYHRFDIGIDFMKQKKRWKRTWTIGAYNVYSRKNPFFLFRDNEVVIDSNGQLISNTPVLKQASIFPIIPSIAYKFEF